MNKRYRKNQRNVLIPLLIMLALVPGCGTQDEERALGSENKQETSRLETKWSEPVATDEKFCTVQSAKNCAKDVRVHVNGLQETVTAAWLCRSMDENEYVVVNEAYHLEEEDHAMNADGMWYDSLVEGQGLYSYRMIYQLPDKTYVGSNIVTLYRLECPKVNIVRHQNAEVEISWEKNTEADGYQVRYAKDKEFSLPSTTTIAQNNVTTFSIPKDENCRWIKVRCYKLVDNETYYSAWSSKKNISAEK